MTKERVFSLKNGNGGQGALEELTHKHVSGDVTKVKVVFGLTADLKIVEPSVLVDGSFVDTGVLASQNDRSLGDFLEDCKLNNQPIFYSLSNLTYICVQTVSMERGQITKNSINIYVPKDITSIGGLVCSDVSMAFPLQSRNALATNCLSYSLSRI